MEGSFKVANRIKQEGGLDIMKQGELNEVLRLHRLWLENKLGGVKANLRGANLRGANLRGANLEGANWDYSCFPIWCGGSCFKADMRLVNQLLAHICTFEVDSEEFIELKKLIMPYAIKSHRAKDLGLED